MTKVVRLAVVCIALMLFLAPSAAADLVVQGDAKLGGYAVKRDGSLRGAIERFGEPTTKARRPHEGRCLAGWPALGLRIDFYNLGGRDACKPEWGRFSRAVVTGKRWRTAKGLRIGDPLGRLENIYGRNFEVHGSLYWLITRRPPFGVYPGLAARVTSGRIRELVVIYPAGGE